MSDYINEGLISSASPIKKQKDEPVYAQQARENGVTLEEYALSTGCQLILKTVPGEMYQAPDGSWQTRTSASPLRDSRFPPG